MNWLSKMRQAWVAVFSRFKHRKSTGSSSSCRSEGNIGLVKLQGDVEMCGYEDVRRMWDILSKTTEIIGSPTTSSDCVNHDHHLHMANGNCKSITNQHQPTPPNSCAPFTLFNFGHPIDPVLLPPPLTLH